MCVTVWRIANTYGCGPYNPGNGFDKNRLWQGRTLFDIVYEYSNWETHPVPSSDGFVEDTYSLFDQGWVCGFASEEQLFDWFDSETIEALIYFGFTVRQLEIAERAVAFGGHQVLFDPRKVCTEHGNK